MGSLALFPVEVGCRGFPAQSAWKLLTRLGMSGRTRKTTLTRRLGEAAELHPAGYGTMRRSVLEVGIHRVVDWPPLLTRQLEDVMV